MRNARLHNRAVRQLRGVLLFGMLCTLAAACASGAPGATGKLRVVTTITPVTALARAAGGERIAVVPLVGANVDPHEYEPRAEDLRAVADAQLIIKNGAGLEDWLDKLIANSGTKAVVVDASRGVPLRRGEGASPGDDPHIWHSPANAIIMLGNIREALATADPANATAYRDAAAQYEKKLTEVDAYIKAQVASVPAARRKLVTNHDTFGYYAERYGIKVVGTVIPGMDTNAQPSAKELAALVEAIRAEGVPAVFTETSINPALAQRIAQEAGVKVVEGGLYGDALGPEGSGADTIDGMLKHNTDLIVRNLR